jgi:hypothetical protein
MRSISRGEIDARLARILADALVAELRSEMAVQTNASGRATGSEAHTNGNDGEGRNDTTHKLPRAS